MKIDVLTQNGAMDANQYITRINQLLQDARENPDAWEFASYNPGNIVCRDANVLIRTITPDWPKGEGWASRKYGTYDIAKDTLKITVDEHAEYKSSHRKDRPDPSDADVGSAVEGLRKTT